VAALPISGLAGAAPLPGATGAPAVAGKGFGDALGQALGQVDALQKKADSAIGGLATGDVKDVHDVVLALNEADLAFKLMLQVRNKLVEAYQEINRTQI
jgi:flagellar hook-basal body complex protein FliE